MIFKLIAELGQIVNFVLQYWDFKSLEQIVNSVPHFRNFNKDYYINNHQKAYNGYEWND